MSRRPRLLPALLLLLLLAAPAWPDEPPAPDVDGVRHDDPTAHLALGAKVGAGQRTRGIARQLAAKGKTPRGALRQIVRWVGRNVRDDPAKRGSWRTTDQIVVDGTAGEDADRAYLMGVLARAAGIPTVWVKTLSVAWLQDVKRGVPTKGGPRGRVFLEVYLEGAWRLLDPVSARLYERYDVARRLLPEGYLAYDRGTDPYAMVLPNRGDAWQRQTAAWVRAFDLRQLPWAVSTDLLARWRVLVAGSGRTATYAQEAARALGYLVVGSFDSRWEEHLGEARGRTLIVTWAGGQPSLPARLRDAWLGTGWQASAQEAEARKKGWLARRLPDGTRVILLLAQTYGPVELAVSEALEG
jgi:hypothetical protein